MNKNKLGELAQSQVDLAIAYLDPESYPIAGEFYRRVIYIAPPKFWPYMEKAC